MEQIWTTSIGKQQGIDLLNAHAQWYCNDIEPVTTYPFQNWADTANNLWKQRNENNDGWIVRGVLNAIQFGLTPIDGWTSGLTAVYASATSITIAGIDVTDRIQQGTKIRYKQGGEYKYDFVLEISFVTDSVLTLMGGSTVEDLPITDFAYSNIANPIGWPFGVDYIEGSNSNGTWRKWTDGTLECWGTTLCDNVLINTATGSIFYSETTYNIIWPYTFYGIPKVNYSINSTTITGALWLGSGGSGISISETAISGLKFYRSSSFEVSHTIGLGFYAIGRWKE